MLRPKITIQNRGLPRMQGSAANEPTVLDQWIAAQMSEFVARDAGLETDVPIAAMRPRLQSPERPPSNQCRVSSTADEDDDWGPWRAASAVADRPAFVDRQTSQHQLRGRGQTAVPAVADRPASSSSAVADRPSKKVRARLSKALFNEQMGMFEWTPSLPLADDNEQWLKLKHGLGYVQVPESVVKWKPDWIRPWGYVKVKPAVAELHHWVELEDRKGWVHMPTFLLDVPLDASLPLRLSNIKLPQSAMPLSVIVASPTSCSLYDFADASFSAVAVTMAGACEEWFDQVENECRQGEVRLQPAATDVYAADKVFRPTVVVPAAICHDAVIVWDRRMVAGEEGYMVSAFGVQIEFSQWMSDLPRLRVAVLTFNVQYSSEVALEEPEALARAIVLGGFQLVVCFGIVCFP
jgi:hypothetical protein